MAFKLLELEDEQVETKADDTSFSLISCETETKLEKLQLNRAKAKLQAFKKAYGSEFDDAKYKATDGTLWNSFKAAQKHSQDIREEKARKVEPFKQEYTTEYDGTKQFKASDGSTHNTKADQYNREIPCWTRVNGERGSRMDKFDNKTLLKMRKDLLASATGEKGSYKAYKKDIHEKLHYINWRTGNG